MINDLYMTLKYDKAITDDPKHPYGIDFTAKIGRASCRERV